MPTSAGSTPEQAGRSQGLPGYLSVDALSAELEKLPRIYACFFSPMGTFVEKSVWNRTGKYGHNTGYQWI